MAHDSKYQLRLSETTHALQNAAMHSLHFGKHNMDKNNAFQVISFN